MQVGELIELLKRYPQEMRVALLVEEFDDDDEIYCSLQDLADTEFGNFNGGVILLKLADLEPEDPEPRPPHVFDVPPPKVTPLKSAKPKKT